MGRNMKDELTVLLNSLDENCFQQLVNEVMTSSTKEVKIEMLAHLITQIPEEEQEGIISEIKKYLSEQWRDLQ